MEDHKADGKLGIVIGVVMIVVFSILSYFVWEWLIILVFAGVYAVGLGISDVMKGNKK